jgi:hypothetical protein
MGIIQILLSAVPSGAGITADFLVIAGGGILATTLQTLTMDFR